MRNSATICGVLTATNEQIIQQKKQFLNFRRRYRRLQTETFNKRSVEKWQKADL